MRRLIRNVCVYGQHGIPDQAKEFPNYITIGLINNFQTRKDDRKPDIEP